jgi:protein tyrosine/serine phosphatase
MRFTRNTFFVRAAIFAAMVGSAALSFGQEQSGKNFSSIKIKNFGQMDERFYRGAQPKESDYRDLATLGIKTVIDLQDNPTSYEKRDAEAQGMRYINIPVSDSEYPRAEQIAMFLKLTDDPATGKFFVHCAGGRHRTGVMGAVYRFTHNLWNFDQAYTEMKQYDFYTRWGHGKLKDYVQDYWQHMPANQTGAAAATSTTKSNK